MNLIIGDKNINISDKDLDEKHYINEGDESTIYKFGNEIYKLYKENCTKTRLKEKEAKYLSQIKTKRILMPNELIYNDNKFCGYTMPYINECSKESIKNAQIKGIIDELRIIKNDLMILRDYNVILDDLHFDNYMYNKSIYFVDSGSYMINKKLSSRYIEILNRELMHDFIIKHLLCKSARLTKVQKEKIYNHLPIDEYMCDVLDYDIEPNETLLHYVKRIVK